MKTLLDIIHEANSALDTYKHPDLDDFQAAVDPVLKALGEIVMGGDKVESIYRGPDYVQITTSYTCRGCSNSNTHTIPMSIITASDPVAAATEHTLRKNLTKATKELNYTRASIPKLEEVAQQAALELATFLKETK